VNSGERKSERMNSTRTEKHFIRLELKYCERCGELWTRRSGEMESRCRRCVAEEEQLPRLWKARSRPESRVNVAQAGIIQQAVESMGGAEL